MFPIRDTIRSKNFPLVNSLLIAANVVLFLIELSYGDMLNEFIFRYGLVPARYSIAEISAHFTAAELVFPFFSFMFLHGGFWHILGNMWFLYIFGDNIEDSLGSARYLIFYFLCGWISAATHIVLNPESQIPTIGASGAIAGVMGAYSVMFPRSRIITLIPILFIPYFVEIPAVFFLGLWFFLQFIGASVTDAHVSGIAWGAHVGGFIAGVVLAKILTWMPGSGVTKRLRRLTARQSTPRFHIADAVQYAGEPDLHGTITITPKEARNGARKLVSIPDGSGSKKRLFFVKIPPGIREGARLRMEGMGKTSGENFRGDVYFYIRIADQN
ncbi:MAG: rhomboid family intramembrane serine protease [Syntrophales bacterium]